MDLMDLVRFNRSSEFTHSSNRRENEMNEACVSRNDKSITTGRDVTVHNKFFTAALFRDGCASTLAFHIRWNLALRAPLITSNSHNEQNKFQKDDSP
ncbi:hypothetical protein AVEN_173543-1 [Araneus ventricosus]|uniref:Uncharacterized protein n=1 Tax=Araneus ventricosus TaxID=182803 RepID=A0A4Y2PYW3_ARAVE|nr:hypothetical protein AVEN_173543-1 [Araneus ventricosus]